MATRPCPYRCLLAEVSQQIPSQRLFRLIGTVKGIHVDESRTEFAFIVMDDGTKEVSVLALQCMIQKVLIKEGDTIECVVRLEQDEQALFVEQLVRVDDFHAVTLRWQELSYRRSHPDDERMQFGFPSRSITADDIYQIISSEHMVGNKDGVLLKEVALVLDMPEEAAEAMLEHLHLSGLIYKNQAGGFLPL
jgi:hypothetical protein